MTQDRPALAWSDLPGRRVGIYGLGVEGRASLRACRALGVEPVLVDDKPGDAADLGAPVRATDDGGLAALADCDVVIKAPGVSRYGAPVRRLLDAGVAVVGGLGLWLAGADLTRVLIVTGTKGKSTTTAIAGHLLARWGYRVLIGGNIGVPPFDPDAGSDFDYWVIETSSYQATDLPVSPPVTAVTSLDPDHLPWHAGDVETYYRDKLSATSRPGADVTVANGDSATLRAHAGLLGPHVTWVHAADVVDPGDTATSAGDNGAHAGGAAAPASTSASWIDGLGLLGVHNRRNALIAQTALRAMGVPEASDEATLRAAARDFAGLPSRLQPVARRGGVDFIDDNLSTNVLPALAAVEAFAGRRVALLVGGQSRGIDYHPLAVGLRDRTEPLLLVTMPSNGREIHAQVAESGVGDLVDVIDAESLDEAVGIAAEWAQPDGVVLLSPAAPSFDLFRNYVVRGEAFRRAVDAWTPRRR